MNSVSKSQNTASSSTVKMFREKFFGCPIRVACVLFALFESLCALFLCEILVEIFHVTQWTWAFGAIALIVTKIPLLKGVIEKDEHLLTPQIVGSMVFVFIMAGIFAIGLLGLFLSTLLTIMHECDWCSIHLNGFLVTIGLCAIILLIVATSFKLTKNYQQELRYHDMREKINLTECFL